MLLSIVECSPFQKKQIWEGQIVPVRREGPRVEWVGPVKGPNAASMRNRGASRATGRWVFFKDSDCHLDVGNLESLCRMLENHLPELGILGGIYQTRNENFLARVYGFIQRSWVVSGLTSKKSGPFRDAKKLLGGALLVKRDLFFELGGFSESVGWGGEELEFVNRARNENYITAISYRLLVKHNNRLNIFGFIKRAWYQNYNPGYFAFTRNQPMQSGLRYYKSPLYYWPALTLFLGVGSIAHASGRIVREWEALWK